MSGYIVVLAFIATVPIRPVRRDFFLSSSFNTLKASLPSQMYSYHNIICWCNQRRCFCSGYLWKPSENQTSRIPIL